ncbi:hypothetical protein CYG49_01930 [Candidatus Saccharibacteria bacterium]|nr:MAG: hypothetical protein CYG49_01930 [Candidatus Saccharibacteria bacterium]
MIFELLPAILAGFIAGALMEGPVYMQKALGLPVKQNIFRTWGQNLLGVKGDSGYIAGIMFHQVVAVIAAILYALFFQAVGATDNFWLWGLIGGLIHYAIATTVVAKLPSLDPATGVIGAQGVGYKNYGLLDVVTFMSGHLMFGLLTGVLYAAFSSN